MGNTYFSDEAKNRPKYTFINFSKFKSQLESQLDTFSVLTYNILAECYSSSF